MAQRNKAFVENAAGAMFVDSSCIDCGTCYTFLPSVFRDAGEHSLVHRQPGDPAERHRALMALLACPTGSIGTSEKEGMAQAMAGFPDPVEDEVSFCGFTSEKSFGAWSWFIRREAGNVLMDSPRAVPALLARLEALGGVDLMVLSHKDDVADHALIHERLGCRRVMHRADLATPLEWPVEGEDPLALAPDLLLIPTPGHTAGSVCLLYRETFLFTGDHLWWNPHRGMLSASKSFCWHSWPRQLKSLERLLDFRFRWVLPGHGQSYRAESPEAMRRDLETAIGHLAKI